MKLKKYDREAMLIYSIIVAGKSANFADAKTRPFLRTIAVATDSLNRRRLPFSMLRKLNEAQIRLCAVHVKTGNYNKIARACFEISRARLDLLTVDADHLQTFHGIGPKTAKFFILWTRPETDGYAALDVHVLRWLRNRGHANIPPATPQNKKQYRRIELLFLEEAKTLGKTPRELNAEIWEAGARRTQTTATPSGKNNY